MFGHEVEAKATTFLADLIDRGREALGHISEESAAITMQVETWRAKLAGIATAAGLNEQMPLIKAIVSPIVQPQAAKLLMDRGAELQLTFDGKTKAFVAPQPETVHGHCESGGPVSD